MPSMYRKTKIQGKTFNYHRWLYEQTHGPIPDGYLVHHINHNKKDNRIENLTLMTSQEHSEHHNQKHSRVKECVMCGENFTPEPTKRERAVTCSRKCLKARIAQARTKVTPEQVVEMKRMRASGVRQVDIAAHFGVSQSTASRLTLS